MRFARRTSATATYAALVAERHLWLALDRPATVTLDGYDAPVRVEEQHGQYGVHLDLTDLPDHPTSYGVRADGRALSVPALRSPAAGSQTRLEADETGRLQVVRVAAPDHRVLLRSVRLAGERVEVEVEAPAGCEAARLVDDTGAALGAMALRDGSILTIGPAELDSATAGTTLRVLVDTPDGPAPVSRRTNTLVDPGVGAVLPAVHPVGAEQARARLRWLPDATLAVRVLAEPGR